MRYHNVFPGHPFYHIPQCEMLDKAWLSTSPNLNKMTPPPIGASLFLLHYFACLSSSINDHGQVRHLLVTFAGNDVTVVGCAVFEKESTSGVTVRTLTVDSILYYII